MISDKFKPLAAIATNTTGAKILQPLWESWGANLWLPETLDKPQTSQNYSVSLAEYLESNWQNYRAFVFCLACGAVVRLIAPLLKNKATDPAILVIDQEGKFVISLSGGHQAGADELTRLIAIQLGATPVLTGSSNYLQLPGIDILGMPYGWCKGEGDWTAVSAVIAKGETVEVIQKIGSTLWQENLPTGHSLIFNYQENIKPKAKVWISATKRQFTAENNLPQIQWHPRVLWLGIGCERGTSKELIARGIEQVFSANNLAIEAIAAMATIDIKTNEKGILELCKEWNLHLKTFPAEILKSVDVPSPSTIVNREVGTPSVAEAAALLASKNNSLLVTKQIIKAEGQVGAVTLAIAQSQLEYTGRNGKLLLIGTGPGNLNQITPAAQTAITAADVIVGYSLYINLISCLIRPGQIIVALPITQEKERASKAIELAQWGLTVAVISSGDCGIYGMAGLVLEELQQQKWNGKTPAVEVFPGITALQAAAAKVGTPLMHDFCAISLSDLLTPWEIIEKRLKAAAMGDFVTALYNPRSQTRTQQIITAQEIFLQYRDSNTPVALVNSAYRKDEKITLTTLEKMLQHPIDMLTTVIIGNCSTYNYANWMITPRGYLGFPKKN